MTTFGFLLMLGAIYATYDTVKMVSKLRLREWNQTIQESASTVEKLGCREKAKNLLLLPFVIFREFGYYFIFVPWLGVYGMQNDLKVQGFATIVASLGLGVFAFHTMVRSFKLSWEHANQMAEEGKKNKPTTTLWVQGPDGTTDVVVLDKTTVIPNQAGRQLLMAGGSKAGIIVVTLQTMINAYVIYLFIATVLLA